MDPSLNVQIQTLIAWATVHGIEYLKNAKWFPLLQKDWTRTLQTASALLSVATAMGITMHITGSWQAGGSLTVTTPPIHGLLLAFYGWFMQHLYYNVMLREPVPKPAEQPKS